MRPISSTWVRGPRMKSKRMVSQSVQDGAQTLKIAWHPDRSESTRGTSLSQRDSKLLHEIEASGQPVKDDKDRAQTLKSHSIQKEATQIVCNKPLIY